MFWFSNTCVFSTTQRCVMGARPVCFVFLIHHSQSVGLPKPSPYFLLLFLGLYNSAETRKESVQRSVDFIYHSQKYLFPAIQIIHGSSFWSLYTFRSSFYEIFFPLCALFTRVSFPIVFIAISGLFYGPLYLGNWYTWRWMIPFANFLQYHAVHALREVKGQDFN